MPILNESDRWRIDSLWRRLTHSGSYIALFSILSFLRAIA